MAADELIIKKRGDKYRIKITEAMKRNRYSPANCDMIVNIKNYKDLALFLEDMKVLWSCPIDSAIAEYQKNTKEKKGPFW
jgi:hypothetical protein